MKILPNDKTISKKQFNAYREVQFGGEYNMFSAHAEAATGLEHEEYMYVIDNYEKLELIYGEYEEVE
jgi:hypothetical protein